MSRFLKIHCSEQKRSAHCFFMEKNDSSSCQVRVAYTNKKSRQKHSCPGGEPCQHDGYWWTPAKPDAGRQFKKAKLCQSSNRIMAPRSGSGMRVNRFPEQLVWIRLGSASEKEFFAGRDRPHTGCTP
jgi:hypothetical protein